MGMKPNPLTIRIAKCITITLPVGREMDRRNTGKNPYCPRCGKNDESPVYVIQCAEESAREVLKEAVENVEKVLIKMNTEPVLQMQIIKSLTEWLTTSRPSISKNTLLPIKKQIELGWEHLMEGKIHRDFEEYMQTHYTKVNSKKNGEMWISVLIQTIWTKIFSSMWEHWNKAVHIINEKDIKSQEHLNLNHTVRQLFTKANEISLLYQD